MLRTLIRSCSPARLGKPSLQLTIKMSTMRAVLINKFGGPDECKLERNATKPISVGPKQVLVKMHYAGLNPVDTYIRSGTYAFQPPLPYTPSSDGAGEVVQTGDDVTNFKIGDRVFLVKNPSGTCAEFCVADEQTTFPLHSSLTYAQGASIGIPYCTAMRALFTRAKARPGQSVLIHGASGGVGLAALQIARAYGMTVYGTAGTEEGLELVLANGAHRAFSHRKEGYTAEIESATNKAGVDVILEMLANVNLQKDLDLVANNGTIVVIGSRGAIEINPRTTMGKECAIIGMKLPGATQSDWREYRAQLAAGMEAGWLRPVIHREYSLAETAQSHIDIINSTGAKGNIVIKCTDQ